ILDQKRTRAPGTIAQDAGRVVNGLTKGICEPSREASGKTMLQFGLQSMVDRVAHRIVRCRNRTELRVRAVCLCTAYAQILGRHLIQLIVHLEMVALGSRISKVDGRSPGKLPLHVQAPLLRVRGGE